MKKISFIFVCVLFSLFLTGCFEPVFSNIRREVVLTSSTVPGNVNSIVRYSVGGNEFLVTQNGESLFYKPLDIERIEDDTVWTKRENSTFESLVYDFYDAEYYGEYVIKVAADSKNIYLITAEIDVKHEKGEAIVKAKKLYFTDSLTGDSWTQIDVSLFPEITEISIDDSTIFCTNSIAVDGRKAYLRNESFLYELNGSAAPSLIDKSTVTIPDLEATELPSNSVLNSAVYFDGDIIFFKTVASLTNETTETAATMYYYGNSDGIFYVDSDGESGKSEANDGRNISCMALTKDFLLFGTGSPSSSASTGGGIYKVAIVDDVPENKIVPFTTNADAAITSSYQVVTLLVAYPEKNELSNYIYASVNFKTTGSSISVSYDNIGLWAYYPTRGNWNRE